jgi:hypothetical protein
MPTQPSERNTATSQPTHSKAYENRMGLVFLVGAAAAILAVFYGLSFLD